ncbi:uncharacterized protein LOC108102125 [Drosophila ficusphila]|uniref:uncharacterized protein LOC108102125 n=1 Tax=Drosophila ficusphila TaxID=30025 RepID=UPI001C8A7CF6|nr:uncharacterized protein LOC108102125 [Drosophila ficusphila]
MARTKCQFRFVCTQMCDCCVYAPASSQFVAPALAASRPSSVLQLFCWRFQPESRTRFDYKPTQLKSNSTQSSRADAVAALVARGLHLAQRSIPSILQYYGLRYCSPIFVLSWFRKSNSPRGKHRRAGERAKMRQRCGSVYTWNCAGELYAIECSLCEQRPLCALSEFPEHMDVWHSDWQAPDAQVDEATCSSEAVPEDELMQEVLAEQRTNGEDNELKQQLVLELNATEEEMLPDESVVSVQPVDALAEAETFEPPGELDKFLDTSEEPATNAEIESPRGPDTTMQEASPVPEGQRLSSQHIQRLIELYRSEPRLWNQSHAEFHDMELCRASWRRITDAWGAYCGRSFSVTDVRIRVSTLCQRFLKQRERLEADGELDDAAKFAHFDQLGFLCEQQSLLKRQRHYARENRRLLELYEHYPVLWHNAHKRVRCAESVRQRQDAHLGLQMALRLSGITLSPVVIQRRLQSLRKRYRLEKISYLQSVVEGRQAEFVSGFEHYAEMEFLHKHIDPYVCAVCGKIFEKLEGHQAHVQSSCEARRAGEPEDAQAEADQSLQKHLKVVLSEENELVRKLTQQTVDLLKEKLAEAPMVAQSVEDSLGSGAGGQETPGLPSLAEACAAAQLDDPGELDTFLDPVEAESAEGRVSLRLSPSETQELVRLYRSHVCLWDPNHLDYHARNQRRLAWQAITEELTTRADSRGGQSRFTWQMLHRKITDYTKYYRKERQRQIRQTDPPLQLEPVRGVPLPGRRPAHQQRGAEDAQPAGDEPEDHRRLSEQHAAVVHRPPGLHQAEAAPAAAGVPLHQAAGGVQPADDGGAAEEPPHRVPLPVSPLQGGPPGGAEGVEAVDTQLRVLRAAALPRAARGALPVSQVPGVVQAPHGLPAAREECPRGGGEVPRRGVLLRAAEREAGQVQGGPEHGEHLSHLRPEVLAEEQPSGPPAPPSRPENLRLRRVPQEVLQLDSAAGTPAEPHEGAALRVRALRPGIRECQQTEPARQAAQEPAGLPLQQVREGLLHGPRKGSPPARPPEHPGQGVSVLLPRLRGGQCLLRPPQPPSQREALRLRSLRHEVRPVRRPLQAPQTLSSGRGD